MEAVTKSNASQYRVAPAPAFFTKKDAQETKEFFLRLKPMVSLQKAVRKIREKIAFSLYSKTFIRFEYAKAKQ